MELGAGFPLSMLTGERPGLWMRIATESVWLCVPMKADCVFGTGKRDTRVRGEFGLMIATQKHACGRKAELESVRIRTERNVGRCPTSFLVDTAFEFSAASQVR